MWSEDLQIKEDKLVCEQRHGNHDLGSQHRISQCRTCLLGKVCWRSWIFLSAACSLQWTSSEWKQMRTLCERCQDTSRKQLSTFKKKLLFQHSAADRRKPALGCFAFHNFRQGHRGRFSRCGHGQNTRILMHRDHTVVQDALNEEKTRIVWHSATL
jgi:hypothetical protein